MNKFIPLPKLSGIISIALIFNVLTVATAQKDTRLAGLVVLQNSKLNTGKVEYIANVAVEAAFSTPTTSDSRGQFTLVFSSVPVGNKIDLTAEKTGMKVVNKKVLDEATILGRNEALKVVMCRQEDYNICLQKYYGVSLDALQKTYDRRLATLNRSNEKDKKQVIDSLNREMGRAARNSEEAVGLLAEQKKSLEAQVYELARKFALVNLDDESETYQRAFKAFTEGAVQKTIDILKAVDLEKRLRENTNQITQRDSGIQELKRQNDTSQQQIKQDLNSVVLLANAYKLEYNIQEAQRWYNVATRYDSLNFGLLNEFTSYLFELGDFVKADSLNQLVLERTRALRQGADSTRFTEGYAFGLYYRALLLSRKATAPKTTQETCLEAIPLFNILIERDTARRVNLGRMLSELGQSYFYQKQYALSKETYYRALDVYALPVAERERKEYALYKSFVKLGLSNTCFSMKQLDSSEAHCDVAVSILHSLFEIDTFRYAHYLGLGLQTKSYIYIERKEYDRAIDTLRQAIRYSTFSALINPLYSRREIIREEIGLGNTFSKKGLLDSADLALDRAKNHIEYIKNQGSFDWVALKSVELLREYMEVGSKYIIKEDLQKAYQVSQKMIAFAPKDVYAITSLGVVYLLRDEYDDAVKVLTPLKKETLEKGLKYFENKHITHPNFSRIRTYFGL